MVPVVNAIVSKSLFAERALLEHGWANDVRIDIDAQGRISDILTDTTCGTQAERTHGPVVPAISNLHSHAFQRAMAGLAEIAGTGDDSFWTWRDLMYRVVGSLSPDGLEAVAAKLYIELLKGGFGRVCEFHYLHHTPDGTPYADPAETSLRMLAAARSAGIGITHLPVFYAQSNFGGVPPNDGQRPFIHSVDAFLGLQERLTDTCAAQGAVLGTAIHSLRAATPEQIAAVLAHAPDGPIHIHVAEQEREVADCIAWSGRRPVEWLLDNQQVDERWCLIHATHLTTDEIARLAASRAVVGLCPATEANLGDGIFPAAEFAARRGRYGIGTDSHVATDVAQELSLLEYGQRLRDRRRNRLAAPGASVGRTMLDAVSQGGAQAAGTGLGGLRIGAAADLVVLDESNPYIAAASGDQILDRWIFAVGRDGVRDVMVAGHWAIREGRHDQQDEIDRAFGNTLAALQ